MPLTDYNKFKKLDVDSVSGTPTVDKAMPIIIGSEPLGTGTTKSESDSGSTTRSDNEFNTYVNLKSDAIVSQVGFESNNNVNVTVKIIRNSDDKTLAEKSVSASSGDFTTVSFSESDYDFLPKSNDKLKVNFSTGTANLRTNTDTTRSNTLFDIVTGFDDAVAGTNSSSGGTAIKVEEASYNDSTTGNGNIKIDWTNVSSESDLAVYDQNDSLLGYEIESFDASNEEAVLWVYDSWVRDGSTQAKVVYGNGPSSSEEADPVSEVWNNAGQNAETIYHLDETSGTTIDSSPNGNDSANKEGTTYNVQGEFNGARRGDGSDDYVNYSNGVISNKSTFTFICWFESSTSNTTDNLLFGETNNGSTPFILIYYADDSFTTNPGLRARKNDGTNNSKIQINNTYNDGESRLVTYRQTSSNARQILVDATQVGSDSTNTNTFNTSDGWLFGENGFGQFGEGDLDALRLYSDDKSDDWIEADYDASPKAGQVFFTQQAAESTVTAQTVSVPASNGSATTVNPTVSPSGQATVSTVTSTANAESLNPQVQPQTATIDASTNTAITQSVNPQVTLQTATIEIPVSTGTGNSINPAISGTGITSVQTSVNQAQTESLNPSVEPQTVTIATPVNTANAESTTPVVTTSLIVNVPTSTANTSNPEPGVNSTGQVNVQTQVNQTKASNPEPSVSPGIVQVQTSVNQTQAESLNPEISATGTASIQTAVNNLIADSINPAINPTTITIQTSTNTATTESLTPQLKPDTARVQTSTNQVNSQSINPDVVLFKELDFEAPTKAIINKPNRFVTMQSRTFKTNDLGDELSATLKDDNGALDLSEGVSSVTLLMRDLKGNKVLDQEVSITDGANGEIEYEWSSNDTPIQEPGAYQAEFEILDTRDNAETVPNDGYVTIETEDDING